MDQNLRLIVFLVPPKKDVNGGILSIFSICKTSREFNDIHHAEVMIGTYPGTESYIKNDLFENNEIVHSFDDIVKRGVPSFLQLHVPEYASNEMLQRLEPYQKYLAAIPELRVNILDQNILLMPEPADTAGWFAITPNITQTTAHHKYANQTMADRYYLPTHLLSIYVDPGQYAFTDYRKKEKLIVLSPDITDKKELIIKDLRLKLPDYEIIMVRDMTYEKYKKLIARAKFTITFGEGFDNYYFETFFSGGITFATYNQDFFPSSAFSKLDNTYDDYSQMLAEISKDIAKFDNEKPYNNLVIKNHDMLSKLYSFSNYRDNLKKFYMGRFTYKPSPANAKNLIELLAQKRNDLVDKTLSVTNTNERLEQELQKVIEQKDLVINNLNEKNEEQTKTIAELLGSRSWKVTAPLRKIQRRIH